MSKFTSSSHQQISSAPINRSPQMIPPRFSLIIIFFFILSCTLPLHIGSTANTSIPTQPPITFSMDHTTTSLSITFALNTYHLTPIEINDAQYYKLSIPGEINFQPRGHPALPSIRRNLIIPNDSTPKITITQSSYHHQQIAIAPSKGIINRSTNPALVPHQFHRIYQQSSWYPTPIITLSEPYRIRNRTAATLILTPFHYHPMEQTLRAYDQITFTITFDTPRPSRFISAHLPDFNQQRSDDFFFNDHHIRNTTTNPERMLIISNDSLSPYLSSFIKWKNTVGIQTMLTNRSAIGNGTAQAIKQYIKQQYQTNNITYVLLIGDSQQLPTLFINDTASDPSYSYVSGDDHYPDLCIGRFSAQTPKQLITQINRSIHYEQHPDPHGNWYHHAIGIASDDGPGDNDEYDWEHIRIIRQQLLNTSYTLIDELYDGSQQENDSDGDPTQQDVLYSLNAGRSLLNYCGHGGPTHWTTTGFDNSDIDQLQNSYQLPFIISVACHNARFHDYETCFCETWMQSSKQGQPTGAVAISGCSDAISWDPPMSGQDHMIKSLCENQTHTIGKIHTNGCIQMNIEYGKAGEAVTDIWHLFGDPSLQLRTNTPFPLTVDHPSILFSNQPNLTITVPNQTTARCGLSHNGSFINAAFTNKTGIAHITLQTAINTYDHLLLTVTAANSIPYQSPIMIINHSRPYIQNITHHPEKPRPDQPVNITAHITDHTGLHQVNLTITNPNNTTYTYPMNQQNETIYSLNQSYPTPGIYTYNITAVNTNENSSTSPDHIFTVQPPDTTPPVISNLTAYPNPQLIHHPVTIICDINDDSPLHTINLSIKNPSNHNQTIILHSNTSTYQHTQPYHITGTYHYSITAMDNNQNKNQTATYEFIIEQNIPPNATADRYTTAKNTVLTISGPGILANDNDPDNRPAPLTSMLTHTTSNGTLALFSDGSFTYYPKPNHTGIVTFTYQAYDGANISENTTVQIIILTNEQRADLNNDSILNSGDVRYLAKYLTDDPDFQPLHGEADVNNDAVINVGDVRYLAKYLTGDPQYYPLYP